MTDVVAQHCNLLCDIIQTTTDPAHIVAELLFNIIFDGIVLYLLWGKIIKPRLMRQVHKELDAEHGITHDYEPKHSLPDAPPNPGLPSKRGGVPLR